MTRTVRFENLKGEAESVELPRMDVVGDRTVTISFLGDGLAMFCPAALPLWEIAAGRVVRGAIAEVVRGRT
jgi:hypothetical protein